MEYTKQYFIDKFTLIPDGLIGVGALTHEDGTPKCSLGHCGMSVYADPTEEAIALLRLFQGPAASGRFTWADVYCVNDGRNDYFHGTPKSRMLTKLHSL